MKYKQIFKKFSDNNTNLNITRFTYSEDSDHLLLVINNDYFTILSITQDADDRYYITEGVLEDPFDVFYEENLVELGIMTEEDIAERHKTIEEKNKSKLYENYLRLKAMFEPH